MVLVFDYIDIEFSGDGSGWIYLYCGGPVRTMDGHPFGWIHVQDNVPQKCREQLMLRAME